MIDDDPDVRQLFARLGQIVAYGQYLDRILHQCCTTIFSATGFDERFAFAMMSDLEPMVLVGTWRNLLQRELVHDPAAAAPIQALSRRLAQIITSLDDVEALDWIQDRPDTRPRTSFDAIPEPTLGGANLPFEAMILDTANMCAALTVIMRGWPAAKGAALLETACATALGQLS